MSIKKTAMATAILMTAGSAFAFTEYPAGEPQTINEMEIAAVYLQPIDMEPRGMGLSAAESDVHLEADIHATKGNKNGFGEGEWMPYLTITYTLENLDTKEKQEGTFMPNGRQRRSALRPKHQNARRGQLQSDLPHRAATEGRHAPPH